MSDSALTPAAVQEERNKAHYAVHFANRALVKRDWSEASYVAGRKAIDDLLLVLTKGKWVLGSALGNHTGFLEHSGSDAELAQASAIFRKVTARAKEIQAAIEANQTPPPFDLGGTVDVGNSEIMFFDGAPVVPSICPVVVLKGSNYEMGRQYAEQLLEIYGPFIFAWHAERPLDDEAVAEVGRWEDQLRTYMPEILEFSRGWADGATANGVPMDYTHAVAIWTGVKPPAKEARPFAFAQTAKADDSVIATYLGGGAATPGARPGEKPSMCSGACAWGDATPDGELIFGATTDHDCTFQATIVAFPDEGNNFIYTPFSPTGSIPVLGHFFMGGHPGMNNKGLAYVHHAGATGGEPVEEWGYGIRRGPAAFHTLQFCNSAREAREEIMKYPVGDAGISAGTVQGIWADKSYGFALEARPGAPFSPNPIIREVTFDREGKAYNFLYANNNAISPASGHMNSAPTSGKGYDYELEAGWFTADPAVIGAGTPGEAARRRMTKDSAGRNRYQHRMLLAGYGRIDMDYMTMKYRQGGEVPEGNYDDVIKRYNAGEQWNISAAHRANAFTVIAKPDNGDNGVYRACIGPANRDVNCRDAGHGYYYHDETAAFWELTLSSDPESVVRIAQDLAAERIGIAGAALEQVKQRDFAGTAQLSAILIQGRKAFADGSMIMSAIDGLKGDERLACIARAVRRFTAAQVRANQVKDAIDPPASRPEMLDLAQAAE